MVKLRQSRGTLNRALDKVLKSSVGEDLLFSRRAATVKGLSWSLSMLKARFLSCAYFSPK